ncbi:MAG: diaminopimelate decarboxylase [Dehalococcoidia bacterium]|nr:diaminopimelate decarboxylase [Dehalococcoidia bacterium]
MAQQIKLPLADILPLTAAVNEAGHLTLGGCDAVELAREFGTPLYVFDEETLRHQCREFQSQFRARYPDTVVAYAAKAYLGRALAAIVAEEGMALDVVSGGELAIAASVGFPPERIYFHGNNKLESELREALAYGIGRVVIDNFHEMHLLNGLASARGGRQPVLLRLSPDVDPHTHAHTTTGTLDSKFGIPLPTGQGEAAVRQALEMPGLEVKGLHAHLGSPVFEIEPYREAVEVMLGFAAEMAEKHGLKLEEFSPGGGFAVQYVEDKPPPSVAEYAEAVTAAVTEGCREHGLPLPKLIVEPGRAVVARAAVALYTVGASKDVPGLRRFVSVDGGMSDNIRPPLYGSQHSALVANKPLETRRETVTIAGRYCESGDILIRDAKLAPLAAGDILAMATAGAYALPMASNYNASLRPAVVLVRDGEARLVRRRETYDDIMRADVWPAE